MEPRPGLYRRPVRAQPLLTPAEHQQLADRVYAFFDRYVKHDERPDGNRLLHYYTLNEGTWRTTARFPVPGTRTRRRLTSRPGRRSAWHPAAQPSADLLRLDPAAGSAR